MYLYQAWSYVTYDSICFLHFQLLLAGWLAGRGHWLSLTIFIFKLKHRSSLPTLSSIVTPIAADLMVNTECLLNFLH